MWNLAVEEEVRKVDDKESDKKVKQQSEKARRLYDERQRMDDELKKKEQRERGKLSAEMENMRMEKENWERERRKMEEERRQWNQLKKKGDPRALLDEINQKLEDQVTHREKLRNVEKLIQEEREKLTATTHKIEQMSQEFLSVKKDLGKEQAQISAQRREVDTSHMTLTVQKNTLEDTKEKYSTKIQAVRRRRRAEEKLKGLEEGYLKEREDYDKHHETIGGDLKLVEREKSELQKARDRHIRNRTADQEKTKLLLKKLEQEKQKLEKQKEKMNQDLAEELARLESERMKKFRREENSLDEQIRDAQTELKSMTSRHSTEEQKLRSKLEERKRKKRDSIQYFDAEMDKLRQQLEDRTRMNAASQKTKEQEIEELKAKITNVKAQKEEVFVNQATMRLDQDGAKLIEETEQFTREKGKLAETREQLVMEQEAMDQEKVQLEEQKKLVQFERKSLKQTEAQVKTEVLNADVTKANAKQVLGVRDKLAEEVQRIDREWQNVDRVKRQMQELHREFAQELQTEIHVLENAREEVVRDTPAEFLSSYAISPGSMSPNTRALHMAAEIGRMDDG